MFKTILVPASGLESDAHALDAAVAFGKPFGAHIDCLHVRINPALSAALLDIPSVDAMERYVAALEKEEKRLTVAAKASFDIACQHHSLAITDTPSKAHRMSASWAEVTGRPLEETISRGRIHDIVVVDRTADLPDGGVNELIISCGRPILIAGRAAPKHIGNVIAIAWKETAEAARAVMAAMPLLEKAERVVVLSADEDGTETMQRLASAKRLAESLKWHGIAADADLAGISERGVGYALFDAAAEIGADLVVMGAYGHSRVREFILGGATRHALKEATLPVFLFH